MRFSPATLAVHGIVWSCFLVTGVMGQEGGRGGRGGGGFGGRGFGFGGSTLDKPALLGSEQVRKELKLNEEQGKKVEAVLSAHREAAMEIGGAGRGNRDASEEERAKARAERTQKVADLLKKTEAKLAEVLEKTQGQRLDEILLQHQGPEALIADNVVASLKISAEQVDKIKAAIATRDSELGKLVGSFRGGPGGPGGAGGDFQERREKMDKLRTDANTAAAAALSKEQTEALAKLKGAPFELDRASLFGGRGGPGGPGGGRGGPGGGRGGPGGGDTGKDRKRPPADDDKKDL